MSDPVIFDSTTPRFNLPMLYAAQAQKEVFVNESLARVDALLHAAVLGEQAAPPESVAEGDCWLVGSEASGDWTGQEGKLALREGGQWLFASPRDGLRLFDRTAGQFWLFSGSWQKPTAIPEPSGGLYVDSEARAAIGMLISVLRAAGITPPA